VAENPSRGELHRRQEMMHGTACTSGNIVFHTNYILYTLAGIMLLVFYIFFFFLSEFYATGFLGK
jgi:hypothetical protein